MYYQDMPPIVPGQPYMYDPNTAGSVPIPLSGTNGAFGVPSITTPASFSITGSTGVGPSQLMGASLFFFVLIWVIAQARRNRRTVAAATPTPAGGSLRPFSLFGNYSNLGAGEMLIASILYLIVYSIISRFSIFGISGDSVVSFLITALIVFTLQALVLPGVFKWLDVELEETVCGIAGPLAIAYVISNWPFVSMIYGIFIGAIT